MKRIFVYNPKSGSALKKAELQTLLKKHSIDIDLWLAIGPQIADNLRKNIEKDSYVYAYGGDGTISATAGVLAYQDAVLVPLPGGTLNHFTKDLNIAQDINSALSMLDQSSVQPIDIASVNGQYFINNSSIGIYARSLETRDQLSKKSVSKWPAAVYATIKELVQFRVYKLTNDGISHRTPLVFIGNNDYSLTEGKLGARSSLNDGVLSIYITKASSRLAMIRIGLKILLRQSAELVETKSTHYTIHMKRPRVRVSLDGEHQVLNPPLRYEIHAGALNVLLPKK